MAEKEATLIVRLKDAMSTPLGGLMGKLSQLKSGYLAVAGAVAGLTAFMKESLTAYMEQEAANNKLNVALKNQGLYTAQTALELQKFAASLMQTSTFADETIIEMMALLTTFGMSGDVLKRTTKDAMDLSVGLGIDLRTATLLLGKAFAGETGTLARYGIVIEDNIPKAERFDAVHQQLISRFGGSAQAALETTAGKLENLGLRFGEVKETIGAALAPVLVWLLGHLEKVAVVVDGITSSSEPFKRFIADMGSAFLELGKMVVQGFLVPLEQIAPLLAKIGIDIQPYLDGITASFNHQIANLQNWAAQAEMTATRHVAAETKKQAAVKQTATSNVAAVKKQNLDIEKAMDDFIAKEAARQKAQTELEQREQETRKANLASTLSYISTLSTAKSKELRAVGKAGALAVAYIDTYSAANKALASAPPPYNFVLMAAVIGAGLANAAQIAGIQLARGGVVLPQNGGTLASVGEAGGAEAVIPLDDPRAMEMMGGGGSVVININAGAIVADKMSVREFAQRIDEELYKMTLHRRSVAF